MIYSYKHTFSGFAAKLTKSQAQKITEYPGVVQVIPNHFYKLQTTRSWDYLNLRIDTFSTNLLSATNRGDGTVIAILDTAGSIALNVSYRGHGFGTFWSGAPRARLVVVCGADGMDTRPYRLNWPKSTVIFDISPGRVFKAATLKLEDVGAKIRRSCFFLHIPSESSDIEEMMRNKGFKGTRSSLWIFQELVGIFVVFKLYGLPVVKLARFKGILFVVSNLATKGCLLLGELPSWLSEIGVGVKVSEPQCYTGVF
ncbi:hypothetical protein ACH5RR_010796 [Cinchona calisaya]|uniref:Inhibitor I9 domain-containing protein n=1 Tax=Cinchona calisaya TaxID=153742 RepID=A0ABD3AJY7_9GENT